MCTFAHTNKNKTINLEIFEAITGKISGWLWGLPLIVLLVGTHIFLTIRLHFPQRYIFKAIRLSFSKEKGSSGDVSAYGALFTALAATIGTGNILGVSTAIALGGPGAVFWCWITGVFGIATKYSEALLAVRFRVKTENGEMIGGPMYALERGLHMKWLAILFCIFTAFAAFGIGNMVQANAASQLLQTNYNIPTYATGIIMCVCTALVILYGVKGIAKTCTLLVPVMAIFYVLSCIIILCINASLVGDALSLIIESAFRPEAAGGGFVGGALSATIRYGISRGLFSNESGMGSAPIVAAAAKTRNPVRQALVSSTGTFWDTVVICALTGLVVVSSMLAHPEVDTTQSTALISTAFNSIPYVGTIILTIGLITFAFSTILGWSYYSEKAIEYLGGKKVIRYYQIVWVIGIFVGAILELKAVWNIADSMNALMAIPNLISLLLLSNILAKETRKYLWNGNIDKWDRYELHISSMEREKKLRKSRSKK